MVEETLTASALRELGGMWMPKVKKPRKTSRRTPQLGWREEPASLPALRPPSARSLARQPAATLPSHESRSGFAKSRSTDRVCRSDRHSDKGDLLQRAERFRRTHRARRAHRATPKRIFSTYVPWREDMGAESDAPVAPSLQRDALTASSSAMETLHRMKQTILDPPVELDATDLFLNRLHRQVSRRRAIRRLQRWWRGLRTRRLFYAIFSRRAQKLAIVWDAWQRWRHSVRFFRRFLLLRPFQGLCDWTAETRLARQTVEHGLAGKDGPVRNPWLLVRLAVRGPASERPTRSALPPAAFGGMGTWIGACDEFREQSREKIVDWRNNRGLVASPRKREPPPPRLGDDVSRATEVVDRFRGRHDSLDREIDQEFGMNDERFQDEEENIVSARQPAEQDDEAVVEVDASPAREAVPSYHLDSRLARSLRFAMLRTVWKAWKVSRLRDAERWRVAQQRLAKAFRPFMHGRIDGLPPAKSDWRPFLLEMWRRWAVWHKEDREGRGIPNFDAELQRWDDYVRQVYRYRELERRARRYERIARTRRMFWRWRRLVVWLHASRQEAERLFLVAQQAWCVRLWRRWRGWVQSRRLLASPVWRFFRRWRHRAVQLRRLRPAAEAVAQAKRQRMLQQGWHAWREAFVAAGLRRALTVRWWTRRSLSSVDIVRQTPLVAPDDSGFVPIVTWLRECTRPLWDDMRSARRVPTRRLADLSSADQRRVQCGHVAAVWAWEQFLEKERFRWGAPWHPSRTEGTLRYSWWRWQRFWGMRRAIRRLQQRIAAATRREALRWAFTRLKGGVPDVDAMSRALFAAAAASPATNDGTVTLDRGILPADGREELWDAVCASGVESTDSLATSERTADTESVALQRGHPQQLMLDGIVMWRIVTGLLLLKNAHGKTSTPVGASETSKVAAGEEAMTETVVRTDLDEDDDYVLPSFVRRWFHRPLAPLVESPEIDVVRFDGAMAKQLWSVLGVKTESQMLKVGHESRNMARAVPEKDTPSHHHEAVRVPQHNVVPVTEQASPVVVQHVSNKEGSSTPSSADSEHVMPTSPNEGPFSPSSPPASVELAESHEDTVTPAKSFPVSVGRKIPRSPVQSAVAALPVVWPRGPRDGTSMLGSLPPRLRHRATRRLQWLMRQRGGLVEDAETASELMLEAVQFTLQSPDYDPGKRRAMSGSGQMRGSPVWNGESYAAKAVSDTASVEHPAKDELAPEPPADHITRRRTVAPEQQSESLPAAADDPASGPSCGDVVEADMGGPVANYQLPAPDSESGDGYEWNTAKTGTSVVSMPTSSGMLDTASAVMTEEPASEEFDHDEVAASHRESATSAAESQEMAEWFLHRRSSLDWSQPPFLPQRNDHPRRPAGAVRVSESPGGPAKTRGENVSRTASLLLELSEMPAAHISWDGAGEGAAGPSSRGRAPVRSATRSRRRHRGKQRSHAMSYWHERTEAPVLPSPRLMRIKSSAPGQPDRCERRDATQLLGQTASILAGNTSLPGSEEAFRSVLEPWHSHIQADAGSPEKTRPTGQEPLVKAVTLDRPKTAQPMRRDRDRARVRKSSIICERNGWTLAPEKPRDERNGWTLAPVTPPPLVVTPSIRPQTAPKTTKAPTPPRVPPEVNASPADAEEWHLDSSAPGDCDRLSNVLVSHGVRRSSDAANRVGTHAVRPASAPRYPSSLRLGGQTVSNRTLHAADVLQRTLAQPIDIDSAPIARNNQSTRQWAPAGGYARRTAYSVEIAGPTGRTGTGHSQQRGYGIAHTLAALAGPSDGGMWRPPTERTKR